MADHRGEDLEKLKRATSTLEPPDDLTDRVMDAVRDDLTYVFERFRERTEGLEPSDGFTGAIMHAVREVEPPVSRDSRPASSGVISYDSVGRSGVRALIVAAAVAAASVLYGSYVERDFDTHVVAAAEGDPAE